MTLTRTQPMVDEARRFHILREEWCLWPDDMRMTTFRAHFVGPSPDDPTIGHFVSVDYGHTESFYLPIAAVREDTQPTINPKEPTP